MKKEILYPLILLIALQVSSCFSNKKKNPVYIKPIKSVAFTAYKTSLENLFDPKINPIGISPTLVNYKNKEWLCLMSQKGNFLFLFNVNDIEQTDSIRINIADTTKKRSVFLFKDESLIVYEPYRLQYSIYHFSGDSLTLFKTFSLPKFDWKEYFLKFNSGFRVLDNHEGSIVYGYGLSKNKKDNYIDRRHNLVIFTPGNKADFKTGRYPGDFFKYKIYNNETLFCNDSNNNIYYTFQMHDSIYKINKQGEILAASVLHKNPEFDRFDWGRVMDLGYVRQHTMMSEANLNICVTHGGKVVVIKQLHKEEYRDKSYYKYFVLDNNLNMLYADTLRHGFFPGFLFPYKKGFMIFANPDSKAVYYETN